MFKNIIDKEYFQTILVDAKQGVIKADREKYIDVFNEVMKVVIDDKLIIVSNIQKITNSTDVEYDMMLYTTHTRRTATKVSNTIHSKFGKFVLMMSKIPNIEYEISYNMRPIIKIFYIERYKNVILNKLFKTILISGIQYFPPEIELMDIYHKLYIPNKYEYWGDLITYEDKLYKQFMSQTGGAKCVPCKTKRKIDIINIKQLLLEFFNNENYVIVGKWAIELIKNNKNILENTNIQIISENNIEVDYENISNFLLQYTNYGIFYKKKSLYVPKDTRISKYVFTINFPSINTRSGTNMPFLDIYNCGSYELIPYKNIVYNGFNLNIGNVYVQLRFLFIDIWLYNLMLTLKFISEDEYNKNMRQTYEYIKLAKKEIKPDYNDKFMGINYDEMVERRIQLSKNTIKKLTYYPEISIKKNKSYKMIATSSI